MTQYNVTINFDDDKDIEAVIQAPDLGSLEHILHREYPAATSFVVAWAA